MSSLLEDLNWRYATRKFDQQKKITPETLAILVEALQLTPTSYGLEPYHFLIIENKALREKLQVASYNQPQITEASHLIVLCAHNSMTDRHVDAYIERTEQIRELETDTLSGYGQFIKRIVSGMTDQEIKMWNSQQVYIALGNLLAACARLRIDATPMEGFDAAAYSEILDLEKDGLFPVLVCPIGYRDESDQAQYMKKVRKTQEELIRFL